MSFKFKKSISLVKGVNIGIGKKGLYSRLSIPVTRKYFIGYFGKDSSEINESADCELSFQSFNKFVNRFLSIVLGTFLSLFLLTLLISSPLAGIVILSMVSVVLYFWWKQPVKQVEFRLRKAKKLWEKSEAKAAISLLKDAYVLDNSNLQVIGLLAASYYDSGDFESAGIYLEKIMQMDTSNIEASFLLADCYHRNFKYKDAVLLLQGLPKDFEPSLKMIVLLADCFFKMSQYDLAINVLKRAPLKKVELDDDLKGIHYLIALSYKGLENNIQSLKHFKKIYAQDMLFKDVESQIELLQK